MQDLNRAYAKTDLETRADAVMGGKVEETYCAARRSLQLACDGR